VFSGATKERERTSARENEREIFALARFSLSLSLSSSLYRLFSFSGVHVILLPEYSRHPSTPSSSSIPVYFLFRVSRESPPSRSRADSAREKEKMKTNAAKCTLLEREGTGRICA